jgi:uncharacterized protein YecT (DUF1311 family)
MSKKAAKILIGVVLISLLFPVAAGAEVLEYELFWRGKHGYEVKGTFAFDNSKNYGYIIDETELKAFQVTAYTPEGKALKTYTLKNQSRFNFNFDIRTETILQERRASSSADTGISIGEIAKGDSRQLIIEDPGMYIFTGFVGCGGAFPRSDGPELLVTNGSCKGYSLDYGGTKITAKLINVLSWPAPELRALSPTELQEKTLAIDQKLNSDYEELRSQLDKNLFTQLKKAQRQWIRYRDEVCGFEKELTSEDRSWVAEQTEGEKSLACLYRLTKRRLEDFEQYRQNIESKPERVLKPAGDIMVEHCRFVNVPADVKVYGTGTYSGIVPSDYQLGDSGHTVKEIEVVVNKPGEDVILVLMAYDPVIWKVKQTPKSKVLGVVVAGYHSQALLGVPKKMPRLFAVQEEKTECRYFYAYKAGDKLDNAVQRIREITGAELAGLVTSPHRGKFYIGSHENIDPVSLRYSTELTMEDYSVTGRFPPGEKGLDLLVKQNRIRPANQEDIFKWVKKASEKYQKYNPGLKVEHHMRPERTYVVLADFELPTGLYGANSRSFIIPAGGNMPTGPRGHNSFYFVEDGRCVGSAPECQNR